MNVYQMDDALQMLPNSPIPALGSGSSQNQSGRLGTEALRPLNAFQEGPYLVGQEKPLNDFEQGSDVFIHSFSKHLPNPCSTKYKIYSTKLLTTSQGSKMNQAWFLPWRSWIQWKDPGILLLKGT